MQVLHWRRMEKRMQVASFKDLGGSRRDELIGNSLALDGRHHGEWENSRWVKLVTSNDDERDNRCQVEQVEGEKKTSNKEWTTKFKMCYLMDSSLSHKEMGSYALMRDQREWNREELDNGKYGQLVTTNDDEENFSCEEEKRRKGKKQ
ncbi:hypothetical protein Ancab_002602 [Ancistrocladus abbreviatus]